jgi:hypothetical protein
MVIHLMQRLTVDEIDDSENTAEIDSDNDSEFLKPCNADSSSVLPTPVTQQQWDHAATDFESSFADDYLVSSPSYSNADDDVARTTDADYPPFSPPS